MNATTALEAAKSAGLYKMCNLINEAAESGQQEYAQYHSFGDAVRAHIISKLEEAGYKVSCNANNYWLISW